MRQQQVIRIWWSTWGTTCTDRAHVQRTRNALPSMMPASPTCQVSGVTTGVWYADFFEPSLSLLTAAPWIVLRGDHETCDRAGHGFFLFLYPRKLENWTASDCWNYTETYSVPFANEQFLVVDDSVIDYFKLDQQCPEGSEVQEDALNVSLYTEGALSNETIFERIEHFRRQFQTVEANKLPDVTNILGTHRPIFGVACDKGKYITLDWTLQQALGDSTLKGISAMISGHKHWFQGIVYEDHSWPMSIVVGNGGTKLETSRMKREMANETAIEGLKVHGARIDKAFTSSLFGYSVMTLSEDGSYALTSLQVGNGAMGAAPEMWSGTIPAWWQLRSAQVAQVAQGDRGVRRLSMNQDREAMPSVLV